MLWKGRAQPRLASFALTLLLVPSLIGADPIRGEDQFGNSRVLDFPSKKVVILTIADNSGSSEVDLWIQALKHDLSSRALFEGVADLSKVPSPLRPMVRKRFARKYDRPMILDWKGDLVTRFQPVSEHANVYLLSNSGQILAHFSGKPTPEAIAKIVSLAHQPSKR